MSRRPARPSQPRRAPLPPTRERSELLRDQQVREPRRRLPGGREYSMADRAPRTRVPPSASRPEPVHKPAPSLSAEFLDRERPRWTRLLLWSAVFHVTAFATYLGWRSYQPPPKVLLPPVVEVDLVEVQKPKPPPPPPPPPKPKPKPKPKPEAKTEPKPAPKPDPKPEPKAEEPKPEPPPPAPAPEPEPEPEPEPPPPPPPAPEREPQMEAEVAQMPPELAFYLERVRRAIWAQWIDPAGLLGEEAHAVVRVRFEVDRAGRLAAPPTVLRSSGNTLFDQSGVRAVLRAAPFPPLPTSHADATLGVRFNFVYGEEE